MKTTNNFTTQPRDLCSRLAIALLAVLTILGCLSPLHAKLITYKFEGTLQGSNSLFNAGDSFAGWYTFESTAPLQPDPGTATEIEWISNPIHESFPGTKWSLTVSSTTVGSFTINGSRGSISLGDNVVVPFGEDTALVDRYVVTLQDTAPIPLPGGLTLNLFQLDLNDGIVETADLLDSESIADLPNLARARDAKGRFFSNDPQCSQCQITVTSLSAPELITYRFEGTLNGSNEFFNAGDRYLGWYTFEKTALTRPIDDPSGTVEIQADVIGESLPGTGWRLTVLSSAIGEFALEGTTGNIAIGNDTAFGDRYILTLSGIPAQDLDQDGTFDTVVHFFQIVLEDSAATGADMLADDTIDGLPVFSSASNVTGRFFSDSQTCSHCPHVPTLLAAPQLITYEFEGTLDESDSLFNAGDTYSGSYTFEAAAPPSIRSTEDISEVIDRSLPGTEWNLTIHSSTIGDIALTGNVGVIKTRNDQPNGDYYLLILANDPFFLLLPGERRLFNIPFELFDFAQDGADMLSSGSVQSLPDLSLAEQVSGNFFIASSGDSHFSQTLTALRSPLSSPTAVAGADQSIRAGAQVNLDGHVSFDDNTDSASLLYFWTFVSKPGNSSASFDDPSSLTPSFVADITGTYEVQLIVVDEDGAASAPDSVVISTDNLAPTAVATSEFSLAVVGQPLALDGTGSSDPEGDPITYGWTLVSTPAGSAATIDDMTSATPSLTADLEGAYLIALQVSDPLGPGTITTLELVATTAEEFAEVVVVASSDQIDALSSDQVTTEGNKTALTKQLASSMKSIQTKQDAVAATTIKRAIKRLDGYALRGTIDTEGADKDWVIDPDQQVDLYNSLTAAEAALNP